MNPLTYCPKEKATDLDVKAFAYSDSDYELQFVGAETNESDIYALYWNNGGTLPNGSFPVTLKSTPPTVLAA